MDEDETADVLVEGEDCPHGDEAPSEGDAEDVASDYLYTPHHDDAEDYREVDVTSASEGVHTEEVEGAAVLKENLYPENRGSGRYDPWVRCEHGQDGFSEYSNQERECDRKSHTDPHDPFSYGIGGLDLLHAHQLSDEDSSSLRERKREDVCEHHYVDDVCPGREGFVADHIDEVGDHDLRKAIGHVLSGRRETDLEEVLQLNPWERLEKLLRE